jgi:hypothetical protein
LGLRLVPESDFRTEALPTVALPCGYQATPVYFSLFDGKSVNLSTKEALKSGMTFETVT